MGSGRAGDIDQVLPQVALLGATALSVAEQAQCLRDALISFLTGVDL